MRTRVRDLFGVEHPVVLGGMASGTGPELVAAVSRAGALGIQGSVRLSPGEIAASARAVRAKTDRPFGLDLPLFSAGEDAIAAVLAERPAVFSTAWRFPEQDLAPLFSRAHGAGSKVVHMVSGVEAGDRDGAPRFIGQDAGLIDAIEPEGEIVRRIVRDAEEILRRPGSVAGRA